MAENNEKLAKKNGKRSSWWRMGLLKLGIDTTARTRFHVRLKPRFFGIIATTIAVMFVGLVGVGAYSTSPSFCRSCHIMEPYYEAWGNSKHKVVACVDCHYPPGSPQTILWKKFQALSQVVKFVTRTYSSKPFAEVEDASCLRSGCHATRLLQGRVVSESGILFDHRPHLEGVRYGRELRCASCHSQVVVGKHIEVTWDTCYLCHLKGHKEGRNIEPIGGCQGCHLLPEKEVKVGNITYDHKGFLGQHSVACQSCHQDAVQGEGAVPEDRCLTCHNEPQKIAQYKEVDQLHANHVTKHNTACFHCHQEIKHGAAPAGTKDLAYDCNVCHTEPHDIHRQLYRGLGARDVEPMPSPMYLANVDCVGCHIEKKIPENSVTHEQTFVGTEQGCLDCHGEEYSGIFEEISTAVEATTAMLKEQLTEVRRTRSEREPTREAVQQGGVLDDVEYNLAFLGGAQAVHNIYYAAQVLEHSSVMLDSVAEEMDVPIPDKSEMPLLTGAFCATMCHPEVGVEVPAEVVEHDGEEMPHLFHHEEMGLPCVKCHEFGVHKELGLREPQPCDECH